MTTTTNNTPRAYTFLGTSDEVTTCDCCGRADLKSTVAIEDEHGHTLYFGVVCAAKALKLPAKDVKVGTKRVDDAKAAALAAEREAAHRAEMERWRAFLGALPVVVRETWGSNRGAIDIFRTQEANGGFAAVQAAYRAQGGK